MSRAQDTGGGTAQDRRCGRKSHCGPGAALLCRARVGLSPSDAGGRGPGGQLGGWSPVWPTGSVRTSTLGSTRDRRQGERGDSSPRSDPQPHGGGARGPNPSLTGSPAEPLNLQVPGGSRDPDAVGQAATAPQTSRVCHRYTRGPTCLPASGLPETTRPFPLSFTHSVAVTEPPEEKVPQAGWRALKLPAFTFDVILSQERLRFK